jgi:trimethylamine--corrinoid protein Co-methyltransferase
MNGNRVCFPPDLVMDSIAKANKRPSIRGRNGQVNELAGSVKRLRSGLSADAEHLAVDIIGNVMNGTRNFLGQKHTMKHLRAGEVALTKLAERNSWDTWEGKFERKQMADHATDEAERILREHIVQPLEPQQEKELDRIMAAAEKEFEKKK